MPRSLPRPLQGLPWNLPVRALILLVRGYRLLFKPWLGNACRFEPSCSAYTLEALQRHGALGGSVLGAGRLLRCHPWCPGGCDPVPAEFRLPGRGLFSRLGLLASHEPSSTRSTHKLP